MEDKEHQDDYYFGKLPEDVRTWEDIGGWPGSDMGFPFYKRMARALPANSKVVELGTWLGRSAICLAQECQSLNKPIGITCVDTFDMCGLEPALAEILKRYLGEASEMKFHIHIKNCGVQDYLKCIVGLTTEVASKFEDGSLDMVYIDAGHTYQECSEDIRAWFPKVKPFGILAGHDLHMPTVEAAVKHAFGKFNKFDGNVWAIIKRNDNV